MAWVLDGTVTKKRRIMYSQERDEGPHITGFWTGIIIEAVVVYDVGTRTQRRMGL
jgi:hypothetical protein